jgi:hypothetical protein
MMSVQIEVGALLKTQTAYDKDMNITFDGQEVRVILHWDYHDGFDVQWLDLEGRWINAPAWADRIDEEGEMSVGYFLDSLTPHSRKEAA